MIEYLRGLDSVYSPLYERVVRDRLPRKLAVLNGVVTPSVRLLDPQDQWPRHKETTVKAIKNHVQRTDTVVEIGSGYGVCTVWSARTAVEGQVLAYEAGREMVDVTRRAVEINGGVHDDSIESRVTVRHALVGPDVDVWGGVDGADHVPPTDIPECDVLVTDCEGSELAIVREMEIRPRVAIVETHPGKGTPTDRVVEELESRDYDVEVVSDASGDSEVGHVIATDI